MNIDFKKLDFIDRAKAIENVLKLDGLMYLGYLIANDKIDVYGWFKIDQSNEGSEYWVNIRNKQEKNK